MFAVCPVGVVNEKQVAPSTSSSSSSSSSSTDDLAEWRPTSCPSDEHKLALKQLRLTPPPPTTTTAAVTYDQQRVRSFHVDSLAQITALFGEDKLFMAHGAGVFALQVLHLAAATKLWQSMANSSLWSEIVARVRETKQLLREFESNDGWSVVRTTDRFETCYREEVGKNTHSFRVSGVVECEVMNLVAVLYEVDLFPLWFPFCKYGKELLSLSRFHKLVQMEIFAPWPVSNRDLVCDAYGVNLLESHQVVIFLRSIQRHDAVRLPVPGDGGSGAVRALIHLGGFLIEPMTRDKTRISLLINTDPKFEQLPSTVLNFITGRLVHVILSQMEKAAKFTATSPYMERLQRNKDVYDFVRAAADDFFQSSQGDDDDNGGDGDGGDDDNQNITQKNVKTKSKKTR